MSAAKKKAPKSRSSQKTAIPASIVWFEIPADDPKRAKKFYSSLFGWKINAFQGMKDYWHIDTSGPDASPDGGMLTRKYPNQPITQYVRVPSVDRAALKVQKLGGKICMAKTAVPHMGFFVICEDTEGNTFALWEVNEAAA